MGSDNDEKIKIEGKSKAFNPVVMGIVMVLLSINTLLAFGLRNFDDADSYKEKIVLLAKADKHWVYLAVVVLGRAISYINFYPATFKNHLKGNVRSNPFFYKMEGSDSMVSFVEDGDIGKYNRANRSIHHMVENFAAFLVGTVLAGDVFPKSVFFLVCMFAAGRIFHQAGYASGYGKHAIGFLLSIVLAGTMMEGLCLLVFLSGSGIVNV